METDVYLVIWHISPTRRSEDHGPTSSSGNRPPLRCRLARNTTNHRAYLAVSYFTLCVGLSAKRDSDQGRMSSYPMQSIDCTVSAYLIQLISKAGRKLLGTAPTRRKP